jgi:mannose-6-phosphate isomerase-like protein (cupin superfamily)
MLNQHDTGGLAVYLLEYGADASVPEHAHGLEDEYYKDEIYIIESGSGRLTLDDETYPLTAGDVVWIPRSVRHSVVAGANGLRLWGIVAWLDVMHAGREGAKTSH